MNSYWQTYITGTIGIPVLQKCSKQIVLQGVVPRTKQEYSKT